MGALGQVGVTATDLSLHDKGSSEKNRYARGSEGGFNDQLLMTNTRPVLPVDVGFSQQAGPVRGEGHRHSRLTLV